MVFVRALAAEAGPAAPAHPARQRSVFEYIEGLRIRGPKTDLHVRSNVLVVVTTAREKITVEVRPDSRRKRTRPEDPPPGKATFRWGAGEVEARALAPLKVAFPFSLWAERGIRAEGVPRLAAARARGVLPQGPASNPLRSDAMTSYEVHLRSGKRPFALRCEQRNGKLWVDWTLTGSGTFEVGEKGWELPMRFVLPEQETGGDGMTLAAEARLQYSSVRPGPEDETTLEITLAFPGDGGESVCTRTCELRPIALPVGGEAPSPSRALPRGSLGGRAGAWSRAAALATLGVQRLEGVRETGLAMWAAQVSVDSVPRPADGPAKDALLELDERTPRLNPPRAEDAPEHWLELAFMPVAARLKTGDFPEVDQLMGKFSWRKGCYVRGAGPIAFRVMSEGERALIGARAVVSPRWSLEILIHGNRAINDITSEYKENASWQFYGGEAVFSVSQALSLEIGCSGGGWQYDYETFSPPDFQGDGGDHDEILYAVCLHSQSARFRAFGCSSITKGLGSYGGVELDWQASDRLGLTLRYIDYASSKLGQLMYARGELWLGAGLRFTDWLEVKGRFHLTDGVRKDSADLMLGFQLRM